MDPRDYSTYVSLFSNMANFMRKPNMIVHLEVSPEESLRRIHERSRGCESGITIEYLRALYAAYEEYLKDISKIIPVIRVNYQNFRTIDEMAAMVEQELMNMMNIREVDWNADYMERHITPNLPKENLPDHVNISPPGAK